MSETTRRVRCDYRGGCDAPAAVTVLFNATLDGFGGEADGEYEGEVEDLCLPHAADFEEELRSNPIPVLGAMLELWPPGGKRGMGSVSITTRRVTHQ